MHALSVATGKCPVCEVNELDQTSLTDHFTTEHSKSEFRKLIEHSEGPFDCHGTPLFTIVFFFVLTLTFCFLVLLLRLYSVCQLSGGPVMFFV